ncbi:hypothetical protein CYMTET_3507 [Cymbomonas tetramitiformis]|uniref:Uncharacterized protein n=1 Tax=Cymbomonas tetramitiformis TaxID=36881 RepID=A0AAE0H305_9CHLO|nr:hypothetical protein CYMTET_3507 [Cymbomonas tetramitiformis]
MTRHILTTYFFIYLLVSSEIVRATTVFNEYNSVNGTQTVVNNDGGRDSFNINNSLALGSSDIVPEDGHKGNGASWFYFDDPPPPPFPPKPPQFVHAEWQLRPPNPVAFVIENAYAPLLPSDVGSTSTSAASTSTTNDIKDINDILNVMYPADTSLERAERIRKGKYTLHADTKSTNSLDTYYSQAGDSGNSGALLVPAPTSVDASGGGQVSAEGAAGGSSPSMAPPSSHLTTTPIRFVLDSADTSEDGSGLGMEGDVPLTAEQTATRDEADKVRAFAYSQVATAGALPVKNKKGKLNWTPVQLAKWEDNFVQMMPNPAMALGNAGPNVERFKLCRPGTKASSHKPV